MDKPTRHQRASSGSQTKSNIFNAQPYLLAHPLWQQQQKTSPAITSQLLIAGKSMKSIHHLLGKTPFFAYSADVIVSTIKNLRQLLPQQIHIHYAVKANPYLPLLAFLSRQVDGFDVASLQEMLQLLNLGVAPDVIGFAGPGKSDTELLSALSAGVVLHVESVAELQRLRSLAQAYDYTANVALRINPDFELRGAGMKMSGGSKPFGIDSEQVPDVLPLLHHPQIHFRGFHFFTGSQNLDADILLENFQLIFKQVADWQHHYRLATDYLNIGGGLGIPYFEHEKALELPQLAQGLRQLLEQYPQFGNTRIVMELGRYLVAQAGVYVSQIVDIKSSRSENFIIVNGGMHHHLANSGNLGQVLRRNYPVLLADKLQHKAEQNFHIHGPLCTPLDIVAKKITLPRPEIGDYVVVLQSGAYAKTASPQQFLGHPPAAEILL